MGKRRRAAILPTNIILLQNVVRRDPESYHEEFVQQYSHYESMRDIFFMNPAGANSEEFGELIGFVSAVCNLYPKETINFPNELRAILSNNHRDLVPDLREKIIQCLSMLRNKGVILSEELIQTIFPLLTAYSSSSSVSLGAQHAKAVRRQIYSTLVSLLKSINSGTRNQKLNRSTQALLFNLLEQRDSNGLWATKLTRELWRRGIWDDSRTVEIMTQAALHPDIKVAVAGAKFFLGADKEREEHFEGESSDDESFDLGALRHKMQINKKSSKRGKKLEQAAKLIKKKNSSKHSAAYLNFSAIHLLRDPQGFAEEMFETHLSGKNSNRYDLEQKIMFMNLLSRLIGTHKLTVLGIYSFFLKYLTPKQQNVTQIMAASAQASHDLIPPELISSIVRKIADEFVSDGVAAEVASAGLNTIREILSRAPLAIDTLLLQDLTEYKGSKSKPVMMAARSLISLYRSVAPEMLLKKDRGKVASIEIQHSEQSKLPSFGVDNSVVTSIPGLELLAKWKEENSINEDEGKDEDWEIADNESDDNTDGEWITVESDKEIEISDESDEELKSNNNEDETSDLDLSSDGESASEEAKTSNEDNSESVSNAYSDEQTKKSSSFTEQDIAKLMSSKILTPADFAKLEELKAQSGIEKALGVRQNEEEVDSTSLVGKVKYKQLREERIAQAREGKEDREKFGSRKGKRTKAHSTTNKEKARKKNFVMMIHKKSVQGKQKLSLRDRQKVLRNHITKQKKKGH